MLTRRRATLAPLALIASLLFVGSGADRLSERERAIHALDRLAFGPRPGDVERVTAMGVDRWIGLQLHPDRLPEDPTLEARLPGKDVLSLSNTELIARFDAPLREARKRVAAEKAKASDSPADEGSDEAGTAARVRAMVPPENRPRRLLEELSAARIVRAADSERQLNEVLVDFWMNHFNVFAPRGSIASSSPASSATRSGRTSGAASRTCCSRPRSRRRCSSTWTTRSPSPSRNNRPQESRRAGDGVRGGGLEPCARTGEGHRRGGLNENYARELMELHTLGVDGGYTQKDVTELARVLTGWSIERSSGEFLFRERVHDVGVEDGARPSFRPGGGMEEGVEMIRILARQPATARHIA